MRIRNPARIGDKPRRAVGLAIIRWVAYTRSSGKDRARIFEYALGSAGECEEWYDAGEPVLGTERTESRIKTLREIQRMLKAIIPRERERLIRPKRSPV